MSTTHTGLMDWRCERCDQANEGIRLSMRLEHVDCLKWVEIRCKKCGKAYRWLARERVRYAG